MWYKWTNQKAGLSRWRHAIPRTPGTEFNERARARVGSQARGDGFFFCARGFQWQVLDFFADKNFSPPLKNLPSLMCVRARGGFARGDRDVFCARVIKGFFFLRLGVSASKAETMAVYIVGHSTMRECHRTYTWEIRSQILSFWKRTKACDCVRES